MSELALSGSFEYLCYGSTTIIHILILTVWGPSLYVRRQILTSEDDIRAERISVIR